MGPNFEPGIGDFDVLESHPDLLGFPVIDVAFATRHTKLRWVTIERVFLAIQPKYDAVSL